MSDLLCILRIVLDAKQDVSCMLETEYTKFEDVNIFPVQAEAEFTA